MPPFSITCTTCKTRLKVRDEAAIGQILACPKCGGLVMVKAPADPATGPSDSAETRPDISTIAPRPTTPYRPGDTLPATNFEDIDSILSDAPPRPRDPLPAGSSKKARVSINDAAGQAAITLGGATVRKSAAPRPVDSKEGSPQTETGSSSTILPDRLPAAGGSALGSGTATGSKVSGGSPSGVRKMRGDVADVDPATAAGAIQPAPASLSAVAAASDSTPNPAAPYPFAGETADPAAEGAAKGSWWHWPLIASAVAAGVLLAIGVVFASIALLRDSSEEVARNSPAATAQGAPTKQPTADPTPSDEVVPTDDKASSDNSSDTADPAEPSNDPPLTEAPAEPAAVEVAVPDKAPIPKPASATPPAGEDPLGLVSPPATDAVPPASQGADPLAGFGKLIEAPTADPIPLEQSPTPGGELPPAEMDDGSASRPSLPRPEPRTVDVTARLADPLPAIEVSGVPLIDFLQFVQDFSTIPISLDADSLWFARATATTDVHTKGQNLSVGDALARGVKPLGLEYTNVDGQLRIGLIEPTPLPKIQYPIKDLTGGDEQQAAELGEWMQSLIQPQSWGESLGQLSVAKDTIATQQKRAVHADLLLLFEKLRVARGLKPLSRFDRSTFALEPGFSQAAPKLDTPITLNFSQPALLTKIVERLEEAAQVTILIDWQSLASVGWNPDGEATLLVQDRPLRESLDRLTEPMDLTWRVIDSGTLQILSVQAAAEKLDLEFYPVPAPIVAAAAADEGEALLGQLRGLLGEEHFRESGGQCDLRYDTESKHLLASLPQPLQKKLAAALSGLQSNAPPADVK